VAGEGARSGEVPILRKLIWRGRGEGGRYRARWSLHWSRSPRRGSLAIEATFSDVQLANTEDSAHGVQ